MTYDKYDKFDDFLRTQEVKNAIVEGVASNLTDIMDVALSLADEQKFYDSVCQDVTSGILEAYIIKSKKEQVVLDSTEAPEPVVNDEKTTNITG